MSRETLKDFLTSKGSVDDKISYTLKEGPDGLGKDPSTDQELLDLIDDTRGLLGDYVKFLVDNSSNHFKIKGSNEQAASSNKGDDLVLADLQGAEKVFVEQGTELKSKLNEYSDSGQFTNSGVPISDIVDKVGKNFSNHESLKNVTGRSLDVSGKTLTSPNGEENDIVQATHSVFLKNNRFANVGNSEKRSFTEKPQSPDNFESSDKIDNSGTLTLQNKFGEYDQNINIVSFNELKKLAASLLLKSTGFDLGSAPGVSGDVADTSEAISSGDLGSNIDKSSGLTKVNFSNLRSKNAKDFPDVLGESVRSGRGELIEEDGSADSVKTFGATYNPTFQFLGKSTKLHKLQASIALIAVKNLTKNFFDSFMELLRSQDAVSLESDTTSYVQENSKVDPVVYMLGQSRKLASLKIDNNVFRSLLASTTYPFSDCVERGLNVVLGKDYKLDNENLTINHKVLAQSPGYWLAVAKSVLKTFDNEISKYTDVVSETLETDDLFTVYRNIILSNKFIQFYNVMATIGDISLQSTDGSSVNLAQHHNYKNHRDIDAIPDNKAVHKSRKKDGLYKNELAWNNDETPSMYLLPANIIRAAGRLNNSNFGASPVRGMFGSKLAKNTYTGIDVDGSFNRIPNEVVKILEDQLDAEYVPFYIQDLRTNEIISFHAFLNSLTDTIAPTFNETTGYGRMDPVQTYKSTKRNLSVGFTMIATSREDFDSMWYKINKLTTLLYPQWTPGSLVSNSDDPTNGSKFYMPFSQVIGASPIVRLRVGDVIKSNYSKFALARTFGIGDTNVSARTRDSNKGMLASALNTGGVYDAFTDVVLKIWLGVFGSPHSIITSLFNMSGMGSSKGNLAKISMKQARGASLSVVSNFLVNGFANPLAVDEIITQLRDPNLSDDVASISSANVGNFRRNINSGRSFTTAVGIKSGYSNVTGPFKKMLLKPNVNTGYYCEETGMKYLIPRALKVIVIDKRKNLPGLPNNMIGYKVKVIDPSAPSEIGEIGSENHLIVTHSDIYPDPKAMFNNSIMGMALLLQDPVAGVIDSLISLADDYALSIGAPNEALDLLRAFYQRDEALFMRSELNPFTRAFETTRGRGLAGVMGSINFDWLSDFPWEIDFNSRAPMGCKISFNFNVIHDIPPGLDHSGYNRAPIYNVGNIMKNVAGDVYNDDGREAEFRYKNQGGFATRIKGKNNK